MPVKLGGSSGGGEKVTTVTGTTLSGQTEGEAVFLTPDGSFTSKERGELRGAEATHGWDVDSSSSTWGSDSNRGAFIGYLSASVGGGPTFEYLTNGQFIGFFYGPNGNPTNQQNYGMIRTATKSGNVLTHNHTVKSSVAGGFAYSNLTNIYNGQNMFVREIENDGTYTYACVVYSGYAYSPAYRWGMPFLVRSQNSNGAIQWWNFGNNPIEGGQKSKWSPIGYSGGGMKFVTGTGSSNDYVQYVYHNFGSNTSSANHTLTVRTVTFDKDSPPSDNNTLTGYGTAVQIAAPDNNNQGLGFFSSSSADTTLVLVNNDGTNNGPIAYKLVTASNGTTTATSLGAIPIGNFTTAANVQYMNHVEISTGVFCIIGLKEDNSNIIEMQKYTYDGNNTVAASGSLITITCPTTFTYPTMNNGWGGESPTAGNTNKFGASRWIWWTGDGANGAIGTSSFALEFNLITGTLTTSYNIGHSDNNFSSNPRTSQVTFTDTGLITFDISNFRRFIQVSFDKGYFLQVDKTEKVVGVALNTKAANAADASVGLFAGKDSSDDLPSASFVKKNNEFYILKTGGSTFSDIVNPNKYIWNTDPAKMPKTVGDKYSTALYYATTSVSWNRLSNSRIVGYFYTHNTDNCVAGTARTIINLSGKSGWLTFCFGAGADNQITTYDITVDGLATSIEVGAGGTGQNDSNMTAATGFLGMMTNRMGSSAAGYGRNPDEATTANYSDSYRSWDNNHTTLMQTSNTSDGQIRSVMDPWYAINKYPGSVVRFESSLTVAVTGSVGVTNDYKTAGIVYVLDK